MSSRLSNTFIHSSKYIHNTLNTCIHHHTLRARAFSSSLQELFDEDLNLETQLNVLGMDETMIQESSSITDEKLEKIFSKIRESSKTEQDAQEHKILQFEDLFPLHPKAESQEELETESEDISSLEEETITDPNKSEIETQNIISIDLMTEDDILSIPSTAVTKQLLSTTKNTVDNFAMNLYDLLQYHPSGIMENDISDTYYKHFGCLYPFAYTSSMVKYIIGCSSHLFIVRSDVLGRKLILNRNNIQHEKYLNLDRMSYLRQSQLLHYLLTHSDKKSVSPSTNIQIVSSYINSNTLNDELLKLSELQNEFYKHFNGLFLCANLYKLVNRMGAIKKIASGVGDMTDFYLMWHYAEEDLAGMNIIFKIWHILNKYPSGLKWSEIQQMYAIQYGEMLMFPEHYIREDIQRRKHWNYFIQVAENNVYKIADPSLSDGALILIDVESEKSSTTFINAMIMKYLNIKSTKLRKYFLLDIIPLRNATVFDNVWKYVLCFTQAKHASYFYKQYHSISDVKSASNSDNNKAKNANVSKFNLMKLKRFLDEIIPQSLPFSLPHLPSTESKHLLPFEMSLNHELNTNNTKREDDIYQYVELKKENIANVETMNIAVHTSKSKKEEAVISPQIIECLWGLLTHYIDGLTIEQLTHLYNKQSARNTARIQYDTLTQQRIEEILSKCGNCWFNKYNDRWFHSSIYDLQNRTVLLKPQSFILYEYLEELIEQMNIGEIEGKTRFRSNLLIHFKHKQDAEKLLKRNSNLHCKNIEIEIDEFSPKYSYDMILRAALKPIRFNSNFNNILSAQLSKQTSLSAHELFELLRKENNAIHHRIQSALQLTRVLMDAYSPYIHIRHKQSQNMDDIHVIQNIDDVILSAYNRYPRRMPLKLQHKNATLNVKNKNYYNDIALFFDQHPNGCTLSRFRIQFVREFEYLPAVPSLTEFLKSADIYCFYMNEGESETADLYLLPMQKYKNYNKHQYPQNGITLNGFPHKTNTDHLTKVVNDNFNTNCDILRRGIDRFVLRFPSQQIANHARNSFISQQIKDEGVTVVDDLPHLCNNILTWTDSHSLYY